MRTASTGYEGRAGAGARLRPSALPGRATQRNTLNVRRNSPLASSAYSASRWSPLWLFGTQRGQMIATGAMAVAGALPGRWNGLKPFLTFVSPLTMAEGTLVLAVTGCAAHGTSAAPPSLSSERRWSRPPRWQRKPTSGIVPAT